MKSSFDQHEVCSDLLQSAGYAGVSSSKDAAGMSFRPDEITATVLTRAADFEAIGEEWDQLVSDSCQHGVFFLRWHWNHTWWSMYAPPRSELFLIMCRDKGGRLVGVAPLYRHPRKVLGVLNFYEVCFLGTGTALKTSEHLDIIALSGYEKLVGEAVATCIQQQPAWHRIWLWGIHATSPVLPYFSKVFGCEATVVPCDKLPYVSTNVDWAAVKLGFGSNLRTNIDRYIRRIEKQYKCRFVRVQTLEQVDEFMETFVRLHQERWQSKGERGSFAFPGFKDFMHETLREAFRCHRASLWMLFLDGQCVATLQAFVDRGVAHYFQGGFASGYEKYHLGSVMLALSIQDCIETDGIDEFDFMGGGASYKESWTTSAHEAVEVEILSSGWIPGAYRYSCVAKTHLSSIYRSMLPLALRSTIRKYLVPST